jgi:hypothetical protein
MNALSVFFPGVWVHELAHAAACAIGGVKIHHVRVHTASGVVMHEQTNARNAWVIALSPLVVGTAVSIMCVHAAQNAWDTTPMLSVLLAWLGISIGFHAIPSTTDALNIPHAISRRFGEAITSTNSRGWKLTKILGYVVTWPLAWLSASIIWLSNLTILFRLVWVAGIFLVA